MPKPSSESAPKSQLERFKETAKQVETDDSEKSFDQIVKKIGKPTRDPKVAGKRAD